MKTQAEVVDKLEEKKKEKSEEASYWVHALEWVLEKSEKPKMSPFKRLPGPIGRIPFEKPIKRG